MEENIKNLRLRTIRAKFRVGEHVLVSKGKMKFTKGAVQNFSQEIFRIIKVIYRTPRPVYELEYLNNTPTVGRLYQVGMTPVRITKRTTYKIGKILDKSFRRGIQEYLVRWREYNKDFDSWIHASSVKNIETWLLFQTNFT
jgi:hypothetical protein